MLSDIILQPVENELLWILRSKAEVFAFNPG
jgi:hypothetical protein